MRIACFRGPLEVGAQHWRYVQASRGDRAQPPFFDPTFPHNIGDWFLTGVVERLLDYDELVLINEDAGDAEWEYINTQCDALILRGGNYIQQRWLADVVGLDRVLKLKIPIIVFGAGLQAANDETVSFDEDEAAVLHAIHERCAFSAVRGQRTADALATLGISNVIVTGCPTVFWSRHPQRPVRPPDRRAGAFTFRQGLYSNDPAPYRAQFAALQAVRRTFNNIRVVLQGEEVLLQQYYAMRQWGADALTAPEQVPDLRLERLVRAPLDRMTLQAHIHEMYDSFTTPDVVDWLMDHTFFSWDIAEYIDLLGSTGMVVGCRLHSNLLALAHGTPTFYLTYDQRTQELTELLAIPHRRLMEFDGDTDLLDQDWSAFERQYTHYYREMVRFLEGNGLAHRLTAAVTQGVSAA